jgi:hypothetical protein
MDDVVHELIHAEHGFVIAPAGCGKTEAIVRAVEATPEGRQLILTHTNAGVESLRARLRKRRVPPSKFDVATIAGWSLRWTAAYPARSGLETAMPRDDDWMQVYQAARHLLTYGFARSVVAASYDGLYVDEYQDCTVSQHEIVKALGRVLPVRVLGDPLQAIFGFRTDDPIVDWQDHVQGEFEALPPLEHPYRWAPHNKELGDWLVDVREALESGREIDVTEAPVDWRQKNPENQRAACYVSLRQPGSTVAIHNVASQCYHLARNLGRTPFGVVEEMECRRLMDWASAFDPAGGPRRSYLVLELAEGCATQVRAELATARGALERGGIPSISPRTKHAGIVAQLAVLAKSGSPADAARCMEAVEGLPGCHFFRRELWHEAKRSMRRLASGGATCLAQAAWEAREVTRQRGRRPEHRCVSRTLLIKGLEFDHSIILDADGMDVRNTYVALTRACQSVTVLSASPVLRPKP